MRKRRLGCGAGSALALLLLALLVALRGLWLPLIGGALIVADPLRPTRSCRWAAGSGAG